MEEISCAASYTAPGPYPEVRAAGKNQRYGQAILSNVGGNVSEMGAVARYLYGRFTQEGRPEVAECLSHLAIDAPLVHFFGVGPSTGGGSPALESLSGRKEILDSGISQLPPLLGPASSLHHRRGKDHHSKIPPADSLDQG